MVAIGTVLISVSTVGLFLVVSNRANYMYIAMASSSMEPAIRKGETLKVERRLNACQIHSAPKDATPSGDIIVFRAPTYAHGLIVHRAIEKKNNTDGSYSFRTQGDANPGPDGWTIGESDVLGRVFEVNPTFWEYNYLLWMVMLIVGTIMTLGGVVSYVRAPKGAPPPPPAVPPERPQTPLPLPPTPAPTRPTKIYCVYCGAENPPQAIFCLKCGKKMVKP